MITQELASDVHDNVEAFLEPIRNLNANFHCCRWT